MGRLHLQPAQLVIPEPAQFGKGPVRAGFVIALPGPLRGVSPAGAQVEQHPGFLARLQDQLPLQRAAGVAAQLGGSAQAAGGHTLGIPFRVIVADEGFPHAVKAVGAEITGEELPGIRLIMQFADGRVILIVGAGGVQAHLEVLVVHVDFMEGKFHIAENTDVSFPVGAVPDPHVKDFHRILSAVFPGNKQDLLRADLLAVAQETGIAHSVAGFIPCFI